MENVNRKESSENNTTAQFGKTSMQGLSSLKQEIAIAQSSRWANRFIIAAIIQGALMAGVTLYLLALGESWIPGAATSKVVASGGAGTWLFVGYLVYLVLGPIAVAVTALFYQHIEAHMQTPYTGWTRLFAWTHLVLMNVGVVGATWLMMAAGYLGGAAALPVSSGGLGWTGLQVHTNIMQYYPPYIAAFILVAIIGALAGGLGYVTTWRRSLRFGKLAKLA